MSGENLRDPENLQKYSNELLAKVVVNGLILCAQDQLKGNGPNPDCKESFRLTTFTKSEDERFGDALAISAPLAEPEELISCQFYRVDRNDHTVLPGYPKKFSVSIGIAGNLQPESQQEKLLEIYDKDELESSVILLSKASKVYDGAANVHDKIVFNAVTETYLDELAERERAERHKTTFTSSRPWHVSESTKLIKTAERIVAQKAQLDDNEIDLQYEHHDGNFYLVRLKHYLGCLTSMTIAQRCVSQDWQTAEFDLIGSDIDESESQAIDWDEDALVNAVRRGSAIDRQIFDMYLREDDGDFDAGQQAA